MKGPASSRDSIERLTVENDDDEERDEIVRDSERQSDEDTVTRGTISEPKKKEVDIFDGGG